MIQLLDPVPFTIENDTHFGLSETQGLLSSNGQALLIEYRLADTVVGMMKSPTKEIGIPIATLQSVRFEKKYLGFVGEVTVRARTMHALQALPDAKLGTIAMRVRRKDWGIAEEFCLALQELIVRTRGSLIEGELDGMLESGEDL